MVTKNVQSRPLAVAVAGVVLAAGTVAHAAIDPVSGLTIADSSTFTYQYEMDANPVNVAAVDLDGNSVADFTTAGVGPGTLNTAVTGSTDGFTATLDHTRPGANQLLNSNSSLTGTVWPGITFTSTAGYTVEVRLKVINTEPNAGARGLNIDANINNGAGYSWLNIVENGQGWGIAGTTNLGTDDNTDDFHTFRISYAEVGGVHQWWVWRNGVLLNPNGDPLATGLAGNISRLIVGSPGDDWGGVAELDYLRFTNQAYAPTPIPEPASLGLLALGGLLACRRRGVC